MRDEWKTLNLGEICSPKQWKTIGSNELKESGVPVFGANGFIGFYDEPNHLEDTVVITCRGATCGEVTVVPGPSYITGNAMCLDDVNEDIVLKSVLAEAIRLTGTGRIISGSAQPQIVRGSLLKFKVKLPPRADQPKIAEILRTWDEAIEKLEALRDAGVSRKKGILQCLFGDGIQFQDRWEAKPLKDISERVRRTNDGGDHPIMTISAKGGFLLQSDKFARDMAGSSVDRYTQLKQGEFAYNKGNSKTAPYGCIFALDRPTAVVPFVYFCFKLNDDLHHPFFVHLFEAGVLNHQLSRLINSGVRNDGLLNLYAEDFFSCRVPVPPHDEQVRIAKFITSLNSELTLVEEEIAVIQQQKRGLMQKLLTGEWRVSADSQAKGAM